MRLSLFLIIIFVINAVSGQVTASQPEENSFYLQYRLQKIVDTFIKKKYINLNNEICYSSDLLDTQQKVEIYCDLVLRKLMPQRLDLTEIKYSFSEDRSKKFWFVLAEIRKDCAMCSGFKLIILKNNCKIIDLQGPR